MQSADHRRNARGRKELIGFQIGYRESTQSWRELLVDLQTHGLAIAPEMATRDGALGFWKALDEVFPGTRHQRCWVHKIANVLNKLPKSVQKNAKADLIEIWNAPSRADAKKALSRATVSRILAHRGLSLLCTLEPHEPRPRYELLAATQMFLLSSVR